jgi:hypothetical protein
MRIDPNNAGGGIQITVETGGRMSFYSHLSDNTKFLFAYHLYSIAYKGSRILLFDEPNNGFHPSAQQQLLRFLKDLGKQENQVIVSTHSEYMIDPDYLSSIRLMSTDSERYTCVKNHFYTQSKGPGDFLALQPIFDAIGYRYGNQLDIKQNVIVAEGVTDLLYLRAFNQILGKLLPLNIAPSRGEGKIPHVISLLISQGLSFKVMLDTGNIKEVIESDFGIESDYIHEIPIPTPFIGKMKGSGIEDLFSKKDFEQILALIGHTVTASFPNVSNSHYMATEANPPDKRLAAHTLYEQAATYSAKSFEAETLANFEQALEFCGNDLWFSI